MLTYADASVRARLALRASVYVSIQTYVGTLLPLSTALVPLSTALAATRLEHSY
jgi:hypothetical protein